MNKLLDKLGLVRKREVQDVLLNAYKNHVISRIVDSIGDTKEDDYLYVLGSIDSISYITASLKFADLYGEYKHLLEALKRQIGEMKESESK